MKQRTRHFCIAAFLFLLLLSAGCLNSDTTPSANDTETEPPDTPQSNQTTDKTMNETGETDEEPTIPTYNTSEEQPRTIQIIARQYEFDPGKVTAQYGEWIRIKLVSEDVKHGIHITGYDEQAIARYADPGYTDTFRALQNGTFRYTNTRSGTGFDQMNGKLVVR